MPKGAQENRARANRQHRWTENKIVSSHGYAKIRVGVGHPLADPNGYAYEHLLVWVSAGRARPSRGCLLHHKNEIKSDNRLENLELKRRDRHSVQHHAGALSDHDVRAIREAYAAGEADTVQLGKRYGIPTQRAWKIVRGMTRRSAGGPIHEKPLRLGKKAAGRLLDGETHDGMPG